MKKVLLSLILCCFTLSVAQAQIDFSVKPKGAVKGFSSKCLSPNAANLVLEMKSGKASPNDLKEKYCLTPSNGRLCVPAIIKLADGADKEDLEVYGVVCNSSTGNMVTAMIPVESLESLAASQLCRRIDVSMPVKRYLNDAREELGINLIHNGVGLPQGYDGSGVVIGIIDNGFDYTQPTFLSTDGNELRIRRVWEQSNENGNPPAGWSYGTELTTASEILAEEIDMDYIGHGTSTSGIAAGCGAPSGTGSKYRGIAPGADIVLVSFKGTLSSVLDGIGYIQSYARSVSKPCVINISLGTGLGAHDGTGDFEDYLVSYMNENSDSIVVVVAAGNNGDKKVHLSKMFSPSDTLLCSKLPIDDTKTHVADAWCDRNFELGAALVSNVSGRTLDFTGFYSAGVDTAISVPLRIYNTTVIECAFFSYWPNTNNKYNNLLAIELQYVLPDSIDFVVVARCRENATMHIWSNEKSFMASSAIPSSVDGDGLYTVDGLAATTDAVVSVGSYASQPAWLDYNGSVQTAQTGVDGDRSYFSAKGPTSDNRIKPDISAPGEVVIVPASKQAMIFEPIGDTMLWNGQTELYAGSQGTSLSAPIVSGIVALWMQHNPSMGIAEARNLILNSARRDAFTGSEANNLWGWGKINSFAGLPQTPAPMYMLTATASPCSLGYVTGGGTVPAGEHTLTAVPRPSSFFVAWSDGVEDNPRTVTLSSDTVFTALFEPISYEDCDTVTEFPWNIVIDVTSPCWLRYNINDENNGWSLFANNTIFSGSTSMGAIPPLDDWLISKPINVNQPLNIEINVFYAVMTNNTDFSVLVSNDGYEKDDFNVLYTASMSFGDHSAISVPLNDYLGQTVRFALRHNSTSSSMGTIVVSNLAVVPGVAINTVDEVPYNVSTQGLQLTVNCASNLPLKVYDVSGRLIVNAPSSEGSWTMPAPGVYILRIGDLPAKKVVLMR